MILSQLQNPSFPSQSNLASNLDPSLESYSEPAPEARPETSKQSTANWARSIPYGRSPPHTNGISIAGSPPRHDRLRGGFTHTSPPTSPRAVYRQPAHRNTEYQSFGGYLAASPPNARPPSIHSNIPGYPPPPHHSQAHFYAAPDVEFGASKPNKNRDLPGDSRCCVFDGLPSADDENPATPENVLLVGVDHGIDVYHLGKKRLDRIGRISDLRGTVIAAKILPVTILEDLPSTEEPLIALVIHGPCLPSASNTGNDVRNDGRDEFDASGSMLQALHSTDPSRYRTSVDVYSMSLGTHVATLFSSPEVEAQTARYSDGYSEPPPVGGLALQAKGRFIIVSSGTSGEVFIYERYHPRAESPGAGIRCIGKTWTRLTSKKVRSSSVSSRDSGSMREDDRTNESPDPPIVSLSPRWLATVPPTSSSQTSFHGHVPGNLASRIPGYASHAAPAEPQITCQLDTPEVESLINRIARDATQEFVKGARWVGSQGLQAWNSYWSKPSDSGTVNSSNNNNHIMATHAQNMFPPTHAQDGTPTGIKNQPAMVSILDLEKLSQNQYLKEAAALQPLATFSLHDGCSMASFAPSGLQLFTASAKGDVQQVWDLMQISHGDPGRAGDLDTALVPPNAREVARFTRITEARIVDVVWTKPKGERLAIVTDNGTVHVFDLPASAFYWPPPRRNTRIVSPSTKSTKAESHDHERGHSEPSSGPVSSAFGLFKGKTHPLLSAVRGRTTSAASSLPAFGGFASTAGVGAKGGKAVAAGINRSFTAAASSTVNTIRHLGENRITLPSSSRSAAPGCVRWMSSKDEMPLAVMASGLVRIHSIRQSNNPRAGRRRPSVIGNKPIEIAVPQWVSSSNTNVSTAAEDGLTSFGSFWRPPVARPPPHDKRRTTQPLSYAEIETHAPYQPFHTDRRVNFYVYKHGASEGDPHHLHGEDPWAFGEEIPATKLSSGSTTHDDDNPDRHSASAGEMENIVRMEGNEVEGQQIVVTTRRKRHKKGEETMAEDDGEFFEDDLEVVDFAHDRVSIDAS